MIAAKLSDWQDFFRLLVTAAANADLYSPQHPQVSRFRARAHALLRSLLDGSERLAILLLDEQIVLHNTPLPANLHTARFVEALNRRGIEHVTLHGAVTDQELQALILLLSKGRDSSLPPPDSANLQFGSIDLARIGRDHTSGPADRLPAADHPFCVERDQLAEICTAAGKKRALSVSGLKDIVGRFLRALDQELNPLLAVFPLHERDQYSFTHSTNVCLLTLALARRLGLNAPQLHDIGLAALLHDIGKLFLPVEILNKPGKPSEEEWQTIRLHPLRGAEYLLTTPGVPQLAVVAAFEHHMKFDGSGYPPAPSDWQQHLCSHMTTIADIFDALRTKRAYREAMAAERVAGMLSDLAGSELHPQLTHSFLQMVAETSPASPPTQPD